jgi:hypothetical protein
MLKYMMDKYHITEGNRVQVFAGTGYLGEVVEIEDDGIWLTEDKEIQEFIAYLDIESLQVI